MCQRSRVYGVYGKSIGHVPETDANYRVRNAEPQVRQIYMTPMIKKDYARYHASGLILSSGPVEARRQDLLQAPAVAPLEEIRAAFGYWKVRVERPLRLVEIDPARAYTAKEIKALKGKAERSESAPPVIKKIFKKGVESDPVRGLFAATVRGRPVVVQYEPDPKLRDTEQDTALGRGRHRSLHPQGGLALRS